jgi:hypothetical protein
MFSDYFELVLAVHCLATVAMTGLVWFVQVVHYPLFAEVSRTEFASYELQHVRRTTWLVAPLMLTEAGSALLLAFWPGGMAPRGMILAGLTLLLVAWLSTFLLQVPCHNQLRTSYSEAAVHRLVRSNWIRTVAWTLRSLLAVGLLLAHTTGA